MQLSDSITVSGDVVARDVGGEQVLLDLSSGQYFGLDNVGGRIWELLSERPHTLAQLGELQGVGEKKLESWGAQFLDVIAEYEAA